MWYNSLMGWVLCSRLHGLLSGNMLLITVRGRKSGREYSTPVSYLLDGDMLWITSFRNRTWWRNLRGGAPVRLRLRGEDRQATAEVVEQGPAVEAGLLGYLQKAPKRSRYFHVRLNAAGQPVAEDVRRAAQDKVLVRVQL